MEILVERYEGVGTITINRPGSLNALTPALQFELLEIVRNLAEDDAIGAIVITGSGRAFCAGGDVKAMAEVRAGSIADQVEDLLAREQVVHVLRTAPKVTIAAVNGLAMGAGLALALACDIRLAVDAAKFGAVYANVGLTGDFGITWLLAQEIGLARARQMLLSAEIVDAKAALDMGMVSQIVDISLLMEETRSHALHFAGGPRQAYAAIKKNLLVAACSDLPTMLTTEAERLVQAKQTADHKEAIKAFAEKRPAIFTGR